MTILSDQLRSVRGLSASALALVLVDMAACSAKYQEGTIACRSASDCPDAWSCRAASEATSGDTYCFSQAASGSTSSPSTKPRDEKDGGEEDSSPRAGTGGQQSPPNAAGRGGAPSAGAGGQRNVPPAANGGKDKPPAGGRNGREDEDGGPEQPQCENTQSDRDNCGACGQVCAFPHAEAGCAAGSCTIGRCEDGYADCDANAQNGCEQALDSSTNCGACGLTCETTPDAVRACNAGSCNVLQLALGAPEPAGSVNGSLGGDVFTHMCPSGEIVTGISIATTDSITYGFNAKCAPVSLVGTWDAPKIKVGASHLLETPIGSFFNTIEQADCGEDLVVTGASGSLIIFSGETRKFIKTILLACSSVNRVTPSLLFVPHSLIPTASSPILGDGSYSDTCGPGQVLTGFTGYAGAAIDGLQSHCSTLTLQASSSISTTNNPP